MAPKQIRNSINTDRTKQKRKAVPKHVFEVTASIVKPTIAMKRFKGNPEGQNESKDEEQILSKVMIKRRW